jgi:hypothetical protein
MFTAQLELHYLKGFSTFLTHAQILWEVEVKGGVLDLLV